MNIKKAYYYFFYKLYKIAQTGAIPSISDVVAEYFGVYCTMNFGVKCTMNFGVKCTTFLYDY